MASDHRPGDSIAGGGGNTGDNRDNTISGGGGGVRLSRDRIIGGHEVPLRSQERICGGGTKDGKPTPEIGARITGGGA